MIIFSSCLRDHIQPLTLDYENNILPKYLLLKNIAVQ